LVFRITTVDNSGRVFTSNKDGVMGTIMKTNIEGGGMVIKTA